MREAGPTRVARSAVSVQTQRLAARGSYIDQPIEFAVNSYRRGGSAGQVNSLAKHLKDSCR